MADRFEGTSSGITGPGTAHYAITPENADLAIRPRAIYVAADGDLEIRDENGVDIVYPVVAGQVFPFRAMQIRTGTTATVVGWD